MFWPQNLRYADTLKSKQLRFKPRTVRHLFLSTRKIVDWSWIQPAIWPGFWHIQLKSNLFYRHWEKGRNYFAHVPQRHEIATYRCATKHRTIRHLLLTLHSETTALDHEQKLHFHRYPYNIQTFKHCEHYPNTFPRSPCKSCGNFVKFG